MNIPILYADEKNSTHWHSSVFQYNGFLSVIKRGGNSPIMFDSLDGISCNEIKSRKIIISYDDLGYHYEDGKCVYLSDLYVLFDREGVELAPLSECQGGKGEFFERYNRTRSFVNSGDSSLGVHNKQELRVGTGYLIADEFLPPVD